MAAASPPALSKGARRQRIIFFGTLRPCRASKAAIAAAGATAHGFWPMVVLLKGPVNLSKSQSRTRAGAIPYTAAICVLLWASACGAQSAEEAAIPVRKNAEPRVEASAAPGAERKFGLLKKTTSEEAAAKAISQKISKAAGSSSSSAKDEKPAPSSARKATAGESPSKAAATAKTASSSKATAAEQQAPRKNTVQARSSDSSEADLAALDNLRPGSSKAAKAADADEKKTSRARTGAGQARPDNRDSGNGGDGGDDKNAPTSEIASLQSDPPAPAAAPSPATAMATDAAPPPAQVSVPAPNLYLPQAQPQQRKGLFSRLFQRNNNNTTPARPAATGPVPAFNSDYATRGNDDACPVFLPGFGLNGNDLPIGYEDSYRLTSSLPADFRPTDLVLLPPQFCHYGNALYLRREAAAALCQMINAAAQQGLTIRVVSAYRDYNHQLRLYTRAVARGGEDQKSVAKPGRSEHFLGTTVDLTNDESQVLKRSFGDTPEGKWLAANAATYGWKMTVMAGNGRRSHNDEPWHLRYLGSTINNPAGISPIAQPVSQPQSRDVFGKVGRFLGLRR